VCIWLLFVACGSGLAGSFSVQVVFLAWGLSYAGFVSSFNWSVRMLSLGFIKSFIHQKKKKSFTIYNFFQLYKSSHIISSENSGV
jgi:hypothetical protein